MSKLVRMLKHAHAGELAAYYAYKGHADSVSNVYDRIYINYIRQEELEHKKTIQKFLHRLYSRPSWLRDTVFTVIGKTLSWLCHHTGYRLPMMGALWIEKIGARSYKEIAEQADKDFLYDMGKVLREMGEVEEEHKKYFEEKLRTIKRHKRNLANKIEI